jgi:hypothetical protein
MSLYDCGGSRAQQDTIRCRRREHAGSNSASTDGTTSGHDAAAWLGWGTDDPDALPGLLKLPTSLHEQANNRQITG